MNERIAYSLLEGLDHMDQYNNTAFDSEDVMKDKVVGLELLDEFGVYEVQPSVNAEGKKHVDRK